MAMELAPDGGEESIISVSAFERLSDAAKAKYMAARPGSAERLQSMSPPPHGEISASPRSRAPAIESPPFEPRKNWLSQQVQGYSTTLQDNGASPTAVAYDTDEHLRRKEPRVLSAPSRTKSPVLLEAMREPVTWRVPDALLKVSPPVPPKTPPSLNWTKVLDPAGLPPPPPPVLLIVT